MFDMLTRQENHNLWSKLESATRRLYAHRADLDDREWCRVADTEIEILDLRDDLTVAYGKRAYDA